MQIDLTDSSIARRVYHVLTALAPHETACSSAFSASMVLSSTLFLSALERRS